MRTLFRRWIVLLLCLPLANAAAESPPVAAPAGRTLSVLPTTDGSGLGMERALQSELATVFQQTQAFNVSFASQGLPAFTPDEISKMHQTLGTEVLSFVYVEKERIAIFLFDSTRPNKFLVASEPLTGSPENRLTESWLDTQFRGAFTQLFRSYANGEFQSLPGTDVDVKDQQKKQLEEDEGRDKKARRLFRELSRMEDSFTYWGISLGMTRFTNSGNSASTVDIGGQLGYQFLERFRVEAGLNLFSYLLLDLDGKYQIPLAQRYLSLYVSLGSAIVLSPITENRNFGAVYMPSGSLVVGPGISFDVPLVGANIRGEIKYYQGSGSFLIATYGVTYSF